MSCESLVRWQAGRQERKRRHFFRTHDYMTSPRRRALASSLQRRRNPVENTSPNDCLAPSPAIVVYGRGNPAVACLPAWSSWTHRRTAYCCLKRPPRKAKETSGRVLQIDNRKLLGAISNKHFILLSIRTSSAEAINGTLTFELLFERPDPTQGDRPTDRAASYPTDRPTRRTINQPAANRAIEKS